MQLLPADAPCRTNSGVTVAVASHSKQTTKHNFDLSEEEEKVKDQEQMTMSRRRQIGDEKEEEVERRRLLGDDNEEEQEDTWEMR